MIFRVVDPIISCMAERIGVLLAAGYEINSPRNPDLPRNPNLMGRFRGAMAAYALKQGWVDRLVVSGGAPDSNGIPVEVGLANYIKGIVENPNFAGISRPGLSGKVEVLPRKNETFETIMDIREAWRELKSQTSASNLVFLSNSFHLYPRTLLIKAQEGCRKAYTLPVEKIFIEGWSVKDHQNTLNKILPEEYLRRQNIIELVLSAALAAEMLVPGSDLIRQFISSRAKKRRTGGKMY